MERPRAKVRGLSPLETRVGAERFASARSGSRLRENRFERVALPLEVGEQRELRAGEIEILAGAADPEVAIAGQVVGQESHAEQQRHQLAREDQLLAFDRE